MSGKFFCEYLFLSYLYEETIKSIIGQTFKILNILLLMVIQLTVLKILLMTFIKNQ